jgi:hypothetical protein
MNSEEIEKLIYENRVLKLELQKIKSKNDFYVGSKLFEGTNNDNATVIVSNNNDNPTPSVKSINDNHIQNQYQNQENQYGEILNGLQQNANDSNLIKASNDNINGHIDNINYLIVPDNNKVFKSAIKNGLDLNSKNFRSDMNLKNQINYGNENAFKNDIDSVNKINNILNNLMMNNKADSISELSIKKKTFSDIISYSENNRSNKKSSAYNSLFKAGESLISGQLSALQRNINLDRKNKSPEVIALKQVNERLKYLENLEKESSMLLNKQRDKIKTEKIKKEEEMKKKIEDVIFFNPIFKSNIEIILFSIKLKLIS